jgi:hypothetical protein
MPLDEVLTAGRTGVDLHPGRAGAPLPRVATSRTLEAAMRSAGVAGAVVASRHSRPGATPAGVTGAGAAGAGPGGGA